MTFMRRMGMLVFSVALVCVMMGTALAGPPGSGWLVQFGSTGNDEPFDAAPDLSGGIYFTGLSNGSFGGANQGSFDIIGGRGDAAGNEVWRGQWGTTAPDSAEGISSFPGGVVMGGGSAGDFDGNGNDGGFDAVLLSLDVFGRERWREQDGTPQTDGVAGQDCDSNGSTVAAGFTIGSQFAGNAGGTDATLTGWDPGAGGNSWGRQFGTSGNDEAFDAAADGEGGIYYTGLSNGSYGGANQGSFDIIGGRVDTDGNEVWRRQWGTTAPDSAEGICSHPSNVVMGGGSAGNFDGNGNDGGFDAVLLSLDELGRERWDDQVGTPQTDGVAGLCCDDNGGTVGAGFTNGSLYGDNAGGTDGWVAGWNPGGTATWTMQAGTTATDVFNDVAGNGPPDTGIVTGWTNGSLFGDNQGGSDIIIGSYNSDGSTNWCHQLGTPFTDQGSRIALDENGNTYITGHTFGSLFDSNQGNADGFVAKFSSDGELQWGRQFGTNQADIPRAITPDGSGGVLVAGGTNGNLGGMNAGSTDAFVIYFDSAGSLLVTRQFGTEGSETIYAIINDGTEGVGGHFLVAGSTTGSLYGANAGGADVFLAKFPIIPCPWDIDGSGSVGASDLLTLLASWGPCKGCPADFDDNGIVGASDLLALLANWGPCP